MCLNAAILLIPGTEIKCLVNTKRQEEVNLLPSFRDRKAELPAIRYYAGAQLRLDTTTFLLRAFGLGQLGTRMPYAMVLSHIP